MPEIALNPPPFNPTPRVRGAWGEARQRGRDRNNSSKTMFLTCWNRSCHCIAWERGRLARMPGRAGILPHLGARASRPHWERGHLALDAPRGRDVLAVQGQVFWEASAFPISFWA